MPSNIHIHQIYYNDETKKELDHGFIPLDNTVNERPDWYEFWPIRNWLKSNSLNENDWYGFLSPKFFLKTRLTSLDITTIIEQFKEEADIITFCMVWDQAAYFKNIFEQGEIWHPGITEITQTFLDYISEKIDLKEMVNYSNTAVFSNFIIAKPKFWKKWLYLADAFFDYVENNEKLKSMTTSYGSVLNQTFMKTFVQERFASIILSRGGFITIPIDMSLYVPIFDQIFDSNPIVKRSLIICNLLKENYINTGNIEFLNAYGLIRSQIKLKKPAST